MPAGIEFILQDAVGGAKNTQGILRGIVKLCCASLGIDCSGGPRKYLLCKGFSDLSPHGVQA